MKRRSFNIKGLFVSYEQALSGFVKNVRFFFIKVLTRHKEHGIINDACERIWV